MGAPLDAEALEAALRHFVASLDMYMEKHLEQRGMWPALTKRFAEDYERRVGA